MAIESKITSGGWFKSMRGALAGLLLLLLFGCATPIHTPTPSSTPAPTQTPVSVQLTGPWVLVFGGIVVEMTTPAEVPYAEEVWFHLGLSNIGRGTRTFFHGTDLAEFIITKDGVQVTASHDQLEFGDVQYTNELGAGRTRSFETGFMTGTFVGLLVDDDFQPLPAGDYEVYGIARMGLVAGEEYEEFKTPIAPLRILPGK